MGLLDFIKQVFQSYDFNSLASIQKIPNKQNLMKDSSILSELQKKATEHKKNGNMELSIACLEKTFNIMLDSNYYWEPYVDRYIKYLKNDRQFEKAREIEKVVKKRQSKQSIIEEYIVDAKKLNTDLVEASYPPCCDAETAKYRGRIFSISGKDKRFPVLSETVKNCDLSFCPFIYGISTPLYCKPGEEIQFSNRPFIDERSEKELIMYNESVKKNTLHESNEDEYYWLYENLPDIAPKSLSGYVRMKSSNSKNFQNLVEKAKEHGYTIKCKS